MAGTLGVDQAQLATMALSADPGRARRWPRSWTASASPTVPPRRLLAGFTSATTREDLARAAHDGVVLGLLRARPA